MMHVKKSNSGLNALNALDALFSMLFECAFPFAFVAAGMTWSRGDVGNLSEGSAAVGYCSVLCLSQILPDAT